MGTGEIKTIEFQDFTMEYNTRYKDDELEIFGRGKEIIESCTTYEHLESASKVVELIGKNYIGVKNALLYLWEYKRNQIKKDQENIDKMFDHGEATNDPELDK